MAHAGEGKDNTLLEAVRELEKEVERLMQVLEINVPREEEKAQDHTISHGVVGHRIQDAIYRLGTVRNLVVDSADFAQRLIKAIGE